MLIAVGQQADAAQCSQQAVTLLEPLPQGAEFALACRTHALIALARRDTDAAIRWGERAIELATRCGDHDVAGMTEAAVGRARMIVDYDDGGTYLEVCLQRAIGRDPANHAANDFAHLGERSTQLHHFERAERYLAEGIAFTDGQDLDTFTRLMLSWYSLALMHLGRWTASADAARRVVRRSGMSAANRLPALIALGRLHSRCDLADAGVALDEALALSTLIGTSETLGVVRAARAEAAWVANDLARTHREACAAFDIACNERNEWVAGELAYWRWKAGDNGVPLDGLAKPFALQIACQWRDAAELWRTLGCPYEEARALAEGDDQARREALQTMQQLGAFRAAQDLRRALRASGSGPVPRGPYGATRTHPFHLTSRQAEILAMLTAGLSNADIARRLALSPKTVDHHVAAVLAKLDVDTRKAAATLAQQHGLVGSN